MAGPLRLAILISGSGRTLQNFINEIAAGRLDARIEIVVSSAEGVSGIEKARRAGLPVVVVDRKRHSSTASFSAAVAEALSRHEVDLVLLAGFLHLWRFPETY